MFKYILILVLGFTIILSGCITINNYETNIIDNNTINDKNVDSESNTIEIQITTDLNKNEISDANLNDSISQEVISEIVSVSQRECYLEGNFWALNGDCLPQTKYSTNTDDCIDNDGGQYVLEKSTIINSKANILAEDICLDSGIHGVHDVVRENYCVNGEIKQIDYSCSDLGSGYYCIDGACVKAKSCVASEEYNLRSQGEIVFNNNIYSLMDRCDTILEEGGYYFLTEYYCVDNQAAWARVACEDYYPGSVCLSGKCEYKK